ncbi:MAG TPA: aminodeoxychorismate/anthranilate synthase component II [Fusibacter sp.]|nr:aminodeoxychorismate/anthranilate synthase component II [Fusibacter sp.]
MFLMIDNYDSFVYNLVHYFLELGEQVAIYRNDALTIEKIYELNPEGIIISPGPKDPSETGICEAVIRTFATQIPIFGVCLGHQAIAYVHGADVVKGARPMHGKISEATHNGQGIFSGIPSPVKVTRYHSLVVDPATLSDDFIISATSEDGAIMGIKHRTLLLEGVQFHPEAVLTEYGHDMIKNYVAWCKEALHAKKSGL